MEIKKELNEFIRRADEKIGDLGRGTLEFVQDSIEIAKIEEEITIQQNRFAELKNSIGDLIWEKYTEENHECKCAKEILEQMKVCCDEIEKLQAAQKERREQIQSYNPTDVEKKKVAKAAMYAAVEGKKE